MNVTIIKAILFDLDDTLLDDAKATLAYRHTFYLRHADKIVLTFEEFHESWEQLVTADLVNLAKGTITLHEARCNRIRQLFESPAMTDAEAHGYVNEFIDLYQSSWELFPDTCAALDDLVKHYPLAIVTNGDRKQQLQKIRHFGLERYFGAIITGEDAGASKPERKIFDYAAKRMNVPNRNCLFVGDGYEKDVLGSLHAGMHPVWLCRDDSGDVPDKMYDKVRVVHSLTDVAYLCIK